MNQILKEDIETISASELIDWNKLKNKSIFITGATGLICSILIKSIILKNEIENLNIKMYLLVRNINTAKEMYGENLNIQYIETSIEEFKEYNFKVDYIIHAASPTKSKFFIEKPVETLNTSIIGTRNVLEFAKKSKIESMIYLSSMEMYGTMDSENVTEEMLGYINPLDVRSSYSEGKRACELYCYSYNKEYEIPVKIGRIAQTFGAGISKNENRVYKVFADSILKKEDIVLKSTGSTIINYSYTTDTVIAILYILLNGKNGEAYNIVGEKTNMTILQSAKWLAEQFGNGKVDVKVQIPKENAGFAPDNKMVLSNQKLKNLGWNSKYNLKEGYSRLLEYLKEERKNEI